jgi:hypothetical protein
MTMHNVTRFGRRVGLGVAWTVAVSRLLFATASVAAGRPSGDPPAAATVEQGPVAVVEIEMPAPTAPAPMPPPPAARDPWESDMRATTWMLVGATLVLLAITLMLLANG